MDYLNFGFASTSYGVVDENIETHFDQILMIIFCRLAAKIKMFRDLIKSFMIASDIQFQVHVVIKRRTEK